MTNRRLDVYRVAVELRRAAMRAVPKGVNRSLRDQLDRASASVVLNINEGAGRWERGDKRRFYEYAKGSAYETAAALDIMDVVDPAVFELSDRVIAMLTVLCRRMQSDG